MFISNFDLRIQKSYILGGFSNLFDWIQYITDNGSYTNITINFTGINQILNTFNTNISTLKYFNEKLESADYFNEDREYYNSQYGVKSRQSNKFIENFVFFHFDIRRANL